MSAAVAASAPGNAGRSLWSEAWGRLAANRAALASLYVLGAIALACVFGPLFTGHAYDHVYRDYVRAPASLTAYPTASQARAQIERIANRMRTRLASADIDGRSARISIIAEKPIDERSLREFRRSDLFGAARIVDKSADGRRFDLDVPLAHRRFLFGTDANGRDLLTRTLIAGRISLAIGLLATLVALAIGVTYGAISGYVGGRTDLVMMRIVDVLYALPFIFFVILLVVFFGRNLVLMFVAVGCIEWLDMARIVRGQTLSLRRQEYVQAAEAMGVGTSGILARHIVPNLLGTVIVYMTLLVPKVILLESFLSFLGLGVQEPLTSWGVLISDGARNIESAPGLLLFPAGFLVATLFALNFLGDGLRDALDPKER